MTQSLADTLNPRLYAWFQLSITKTNTDLSTLSLITIEVQSNNQAILKIGSKQILNLLKIYDKLTPNTNLASSHRGVNIYKTIFIFRNEGYNIEFLARQINKLLKRIKLISSFEQSETNGDVVIDYLPPITKLAKRTKFIKF